MSERNMQDQKYSKCGGEMDSGKVHAEGLMYYSDWQKPGLPD